ncbi:uncharacterized protein F4807DRAFT_409698 [Annulohypoxylon truncatum]|uniref:uncharacterized protein n=1 Tax=Annulohypoxylon truncatum TaxID=327061 RepID=UPI002008E5BC|nr:uncharacterized protein F4807DRAFT_409698 [Annulohypoxylon truncatum]KAI1213919.1 hypothetical protein F4807DRAFT_409698 [Annulohypoxylon truncatum]
MMEPYSFENPELFEGYGSSEGSVPKEKDIFETDPATCCDCGETDKFEHTGDPDEAMCKNCAHIICSNCDHKGGGGSSGFRSSHPTPTIFHGVGNPPQSPTNVQEKHDKEIPELVNIPVTEDLWEGRGVKKHSPQRTQPNLMSSHADEDSNQLDLEFSGESSCNDSIFSEPVSIPSTQTSQTGEMNTLLVQEFAALFRRDELIMLDIPIAISKEDVGFEKTRDRFRKLLKRYALDLKVEARSKNHREVVKFVSSLSSNITRELFAQFSVGSQIQIPDALQRNPDRREKVNEFLRNLHGDFEPIESHDDSDQDSLDEDDDEEELYDGFLPHLDQLGQFITGSIAYKVLRRRLHEFVHPSLRSRLRHLLEMWSRNDHKYHAYVAPYRLLDLAAELQYINPHEIRFETGEKPKYMPQIIGHCQSTIENWTGEHWDWSPLPRFARPLKDGEARICWECTCGEKRHVEVPLVFFKRLQSIIRSLPRTTQLPLTQIHGGSSGLASTSNNQSQATPPQQNQGHQQSARSHSTNAAQSGAQLQAALSNTNTLSYRVILTVKRGIEYKIAQIGVINGLCCQEFFSALKKDYFRLRGFIRAWFSIWRYSHCDFYRCEKFDDHQFVPIKKNAFPEVMNTDYEYRPRPMDLIPPISEHEFATRFYACHKSQSRYHWYHKCKALGLHSTDILDFFPKKMTELEEAGNKREVFWGIYAREMISLRWVIAYHVVCALPPLVFFGIRILPAGYATDLQNPSVPLTMMFGMLSLFWSIYIGSLQTFKTAS